MILFTGRIRSGTVSLSPVNSLKNIKTKNGIIIHTLATLLSIKRGSTANNNGIYTAKNHYVHKYICCREFAYTKALYSK